MRKVQEFILEGKEVYVGLEDSKRTWKLCVRSGRRVVHEASMPAQYEALKQYLRKQFPRCTVHVMYEAGFSGFGLHDQLEADGVDCIVTPPHTVTQERCQKQKNDRIDARRLAVNLENGDYRSCAVPDKELREDRQISRHYGQVQSDIRMVKNRIRRALEYHGLDKNFAPGHWTDREYTAVLKKLKSLKVSASLLLSFRLDLQELTALRRIKKDVLLALRKLARQKRYATSVRLLKSVPGVGSLTAIRLTLEWGDVRRFKRKQAFGSFLGLVPGEYSSGEQERKGRITKQGNHYSRHTLIESSWVAIRKDPALLAFFNRVVQHTGSTKKAIVAVARKLALRMRAILLLGQPYQLAVIQ